MQLLVTFKLITYLVNQVLYLITNNKNNVLYSLYNLYSLYIWRAVQVYLRKNKNLQIHP